MHIPFILLSLINAVIMCIAQKVITTIYKYFIGPCFANGTNLKQGNWQRQFILICAKTKQSQYILIPSRGL